MAGSIEIIADVRNALIGHFNRNYRAIRALWGQADKSARHAPTLGEPENDSGKFGPRSENAD
jgi:hypothetical protein